MLYDKKTLFDELDTLHNMVASTTKNGFQNSKDIIEIYKIIVDLKDNFKELIEIVKRSR